MVSVFISRTHPLLVPPSGQDVAPTPQTTALALQWSLRLPTGCGIRRGEKAYGRHWAVAAWWACLLKGQAATGLR